MRTAQNCKPIPAKTYASATPVQARSLNSQPALGNSLSVFAAEKDHVVSPEVHRHLLPDPVQHASKDDAGEQELAHADLDGRLHTGGKSSVSSTIAT